MVEGRLNCNDKVLSQVSFSPRVPSPSPVVVAGYWPFRNTNTVRVEIVHNDRPSCWRQGGADCPKPRTDPTICIHAILCEYFPSDLPKAHWHLFRGGGVRDFRQNVWPGRRSSSTVEGS